MGVLYPGQIGIWRSFVLFREEMGQPGEQHSDKLSSHTMYGSDLELIPDLIGGRPALS